MGFESAKTAGERVHAAFRGAPNGTSREMAMTPNERADLEQRLSTVRSVGEWHLFWAVANFAGTVVLGILTFAMFSIGGPWGAIPLVALLIVANRCIDHIANAWSHFTFDPANQIREGTREEGGTIVFR